MTSLTLASLAAVLLGVVGPRGYPYALALGGITVAGAALVVADLAVPTFYAVSIGAAVALVLALLRGTPDRGLPPGVPLLISFVVWATVVTLLAPVILDGMPTFLPTGPSRLVAGVLTSSNIAQLGYLVLGVCVVVFVARSPHSEPSLVGLLVGAIILLSAWRYLNQLVGVPFPEGVFDNSPNLAYIETAPGGVERFRGILSEPSSLAGFALVAASYMIARSVDLQGWRRAGALAVAAIAIYLGVISTSASFVVAGVALAFLTLVTFVIRVMLRWSAIRPLATVFACVLVLVGMWLLPIVATFVDATIDEKVGSASFDERSGADAGSYEIFLDTFGLGVGLGANRASSFLPGLLSTVGIVGTLLFATAVVTLLRRGSAVREYRPVAWALVALLVIKVVAGPDLSDPSGIMWISLGLLARAAMLAERERQTASRPASPVLVGAPYLDAPTDPCAEPAPRHAAPTRRPGHRRADRPPSRPERHAP
ncbi:MAG: hypothetical protein AB7J32_07645 [Pseudonocardia sp.]